MNVSAITPNFSGIGSATLKAAAPYLGVGTAQGGLAYASFAKQQGTSLLAKGFNWLTQKAATVSENGLSKAYNWVKGLFVKATEEATPTAWKFLSKGQNQAVSALNAASPVIGTVSAYGALRNLTKGVETLLNKTGITQIIEKVGSKIAHVVS